MDQNRKDKFPQQPNEGEGNRTAAREYNQAQQRFVKSGKVDEKIRRELEHAETVGKSHAAEEDPQVTRRR